MVALAAVVAFRSSAAGLVAAVAGRAAVVSPVEEPAAVRWAVARAEARSAAAPVEARSVEVGARSVEVEAQSVEVEARRAVAEARRAGAEARSLR